MSHGARKVEADALELPVQERAHLAHRLLESLDEGVVENPTEVAKPWEAEIEQRIREYRSGKRRNNPCIGGLFRSKISYRARLSAGS